MRLLKFPILIVLFLAAVFIGNARAQISCSDITRSSLDEIYVPFTKGKPGTVVEIPLELKNDSIVTAFQFLIQFDTTYLTPVFTRDSTCAQSDTLGNCTRWTVDTTYVDNQVLGRFVKLDSTLGDFGWEYDTITKFTANLFQGMKNVVACNFLPQFTDIDSLPPSPDARGKIFALKFEVDADMPQLGTAEFKFFESRIFIIDTVQGLPDTTFFPGCNTSQMTTVWQVNDTTTQTFQVYPRTSYPTRMLFQADTGFVQTEDPTITLAASPTTVTPGSQSTLSWTATNADQVVIRDASNSVVLTTANLSSTLAVTLPSTDGTYQYSAQAVQTSTSKTATAYVNITVSSGGGGGGPTITFNPTDVSYTINQGETVSFGVTASENDGDQVTLTANSLPNNAAFSPTNPVVGTGSVSGTFSFTPDFNQDGTFVISFTATDKDGTSNRSITIVVKELQVDRLFSTSAPGQKPVGGLKGAGAIHFPLNLVTSKTVYGVQFDMTYPQAFVTVDSFVNTGRIPEYVVWDNLGDIPGEVRVVTFGLNNEPVESDSTTAILWAVMTLDENCVPWTSHTIYIDNGRESVSPDPNVGTLPLVTDSGIIEVDNPGDVNLDKFIDVGDAVNVVSSIIQSYVLTVRQFATADVIVNDSVNVFDLVGVVNLIYGLPINTQPTPVFPGDTATMLLAYNDLPAGSSDIIVIRSEGIPTEIAGAQLDVAYDPASVILGRPKTTEYNRNFALSYRDDGNGRMRLVLYNLSLDAEDLIQSGVADLVEVPIIARKDITVGDKQQLRLTDALLSTAAAASVTVTGVDRIDDVEVPLTFELYQNYPNPFNPTTTITFSLSQAAHVDLTVFNVLGQEVKKLIDKDMEASSQHSVVWDATDNLGQRVSTGIYLYRLKIGDESKSHKMLLLK
jgi:hypothetical protein